jgi:hypothetical protein
MCSQLTYAQSPCALPRTLINNDPVQTSWAIFIAAMCPSGSQQTPLAFENWVEQAQEYPAAPGAAVHPRRFHHGSPLAFVVESREKKGALTSFPSNDCNPGRGNPNVIFCEEVYISPVAQRYIDRPAGVASKATLKLRAPQAAFATTPPPPPFFPPGWGNIQFPWPAVEVKVDWIQYTGACPSLNGVWTETANGNCYALAGIHVISKLLPNWIWATFEPQNMSTNANRCVVLGCNDPFGSSPAQTPPNQPGSTTQITSPLLSMMQAANLSTIFQNYRLDGVQTAFVDNNGNPTLLGNSIIEGENVGMPLTQASCITCHAVSSIKGDGTDGIQNLTSNFIGNPPAMPAGFAPRDFVWSLSMACPNSPFGPVSNCGSSSAKATKGNRYKK